MQNWGPILLLKLSVYHSKAPSIHCKDRIPAPCQLTAAFCSWQSFHVALFLPHTPHTALPTLPEPWVPRETKPWGVILCGQIPQPQGPQRGGEHLSQKLPKTGQLIRTRHLAAGGWDFGLGIHKHCPSSVKDTATQWYQFNQEQADTLLFSSLALHSHTPWVAWANTNCAVSWWHATDTKVTSRLQILKSSAEKLISPLLGLTSKQSC